MYKFATFFQTGSLGSCFPQKICNKLYIFKKKLKCSRQPFFNVNRKLVDFVQYNLSQLIVKASKLQGIDLFKMTQIIFYVT